MHHYYMVNANRFIQKPLGLSLVHIRKLYLCAE